MLPSPDCCGHKHIWSIVRSGPRKVTCKNKKKKKELEAAYGRVENSPSW